MDRQQLLVREFNPGGIGTSDPDGSLDVWVSLRGSHGQEQRFRDGHEKFVPVQVSQGPHTTVQGPIGRDELGTSDAITDERTAFDQVVAERSDGSSLPL